MQTSLRISSVAGIFAAAVILLMPQASHAATVTITITDAGYSPKSVTVNPGDTIKWVNQGSVAHTVTENDGAFDSESIAPGQSYSITVTIPATRGYHCSFHAGMTGTLIITSPLSANASTNVNTNASAVDLAAQTQALLQQVTALQAQLGAQTGGTVVGGASTGACPLVSRALRRGSSGDDVTRLQQFLAADVSVYPEAQVTGYYGALTEAAVKRWQAKFNIVSSGTPESTGYGVVGPRTAAAMALQCGQAGTSGGTNQVTSPTVGGFIEVTPVSGNAPLLVSVKASVNTVNSCAGGSYSLEWGDGTIPQSITVPAGNCGQIQQTYTHTYFYGGTYIIRLAAGGHSSTATVVVSGQSAPVQSNLPPQTFTASPTSGTAPLTVTFSGTVTGANVGWCQAGCTDTITFGDGTTGSVALPVATNGVSAYSLQHVYAGAGTYTATHYQGVSGSGRPIIASPITITVSGAATSTLGPLQITPSIGNNPLAVRGTFDMICGSTASVNWGDGKTESVVLDCAQGATGTKSVRSFDHTYAAAGSYTIQLTRGSLQSSVAIVISN